MYLAIITLPLLGSIVSGFFGRKVGVSGAQLITCTSVIATTLLAFVAFFEVGLNNIPVSINLFRWIDSESLNVLWGFHFDSLTVSMLIPVLIVSSLVHIYSIGYMSHDPHNQRFFSYLSLFTFMMIILITANNFLLMFVGWEGVGICSYLLVSFWFTRIAANQSSMSAFLTNRVGDCFLTIGMFAILWSFGNIDYSTVFSLAPFVNENIVTIIGICLLIGAMAKSSQVGLHVWLPMAMEGPTPVSALIHAATMVTAGVYLLMRTSPLIEYSSTVLILCLWLGAITTIFSSLIGLFQQDIKKVIAYSTMSQLGMMVIAVGLSSYNIALFHLVNHAFYKGLLFLGAGAVIHAVADNQDFRKYGGLRPFLPLTYSVMLIASLSLVAFPFMTGFYSKDFILESAYGQFYFSGTVVYFIATIGAMFTTLYSVKVLYLTFLTNPNGPIISYKHAHEGDIFMSLPLIILAIFSIFFGYITKDIFIGLGSAFFADNSLFIHPTHEIMLDTEFAVPTLFKLLPLVFTVALSIIAIIMSEFLPKILINFKLSRLGYNIFGFFNQRFLIELFYNKYITNLILKLGGQTTKVIDKGSVELLGPYGLEKGLITLSKNIASLDTGVITSYALYILIGLIFYILIPYLSLTDNSLLLLILLSLFSIIAKNVNNNVPTVISKQIPLESKIDLGLLKRIKNKSKSGELEQNKYINKDNLNENISTNNKIFNPFDLDSNSHQKYTSLNYIGNSFDIFELQSGDLLFSLSPINNFNLIKKLYTPLIPKLYILNRNFTINFVSFKNRLVCQDNISRILNKRFSGFKFTMIFIGELPENLYRFSNPIAYNYLDSFFVFIHFKNILEWYKFANSDIYRRRCNSYFNYTNCLYIIRNADYNTMRKHFLFLNNNYTKVVKGDTNIRHFTSDLDIRFNNYLLSVFNNDVNLVRYYGKGNINTINSNLINIELTDSQIIEFAIKSNKYSK
jgi:NADH-ubiquinone oxidoreductase chain 5